MATASALTLEQFLALPETKPASEYACGEVVQKPMPDYPHSKLQAFLIVLLYSFLAQTKLGEVLPEFRCIFGPRGRERAVVPDLVYVSNERLPRLHRGEDRHLRAAPDLAIEILSPGQPVGRFVDKLLFYLRHGVRLVWVLDPVERTVLVLRPDDDGLLLSAGDTIEGGDLLPGFQVPVDEIFAQLAAGQPPP